jgi:hypothetical protein
MHCKTRRIRDTKFPSKKAHHGAKMNLKEGTRRLALLLGVVGAIAGGFVSYLELQTTLEQRARHNRFEQLANSPVVQQERVRLMALTNQHRATACDILGAKLDCYSSQVSGDGIGMIDWNSGYKVYSIETQDGQTLYSTLAPEAWQYLFVVFLPILGFVFPWGTVRAIGWVGGGFIDKSK